MRLDAFEILTDELDHPEGVAWGPDGRIWAGGEDGQIYAVTLNGVVDEVGSTGGGVLGVAIDARGRVYACDEGRAEVVRVDPAHDEVETYSTGLPERQMILPNFAAFDPAGNLYVTDSGNSHADDGAIYRVEPGGATTVWSTALPRYPNGCCLNAEADNLYVAESHLPGVSRIPILADGSAGTPETVVELPGTVPDGIAFDALGNLYVACYRPDRIYRVVPAPGAKQKLEPEILAEDPTGELLNAPTNVAFVGRELDRMVVANVGEWHLAIADVGAVGLPLFLPEIA
ncbi:MAG: SMP-30/gluconolactonase/LRE family protein [Actinomycetota bacterium]|nr:SMP-30/gluconolactonase/LRE family protein [Actinomycetota bacterium]